MGYLHPFYIFLGYCLKSFTKIMKNRKKPLKFFLGSNNSLTTSALLFSSGILLYPLTEARYNGDAPNKIKVYLLFLKCNKIP